MDTEDPIPFQKEEQIYEEEILRFLLDSVRKPSQVYNYF